MVCMALSRRSAAREPALLCDDPEVVQVTVVHGRDVPGPLTAGSQKPNLPSL
jgi:hypothetical protein